MLQVANIMNIQVYPSEKEGNPHRIHLSRRWGNSPLIASLVIISQFR